MLPKLTELFIAEEDPNHRSMSPSSAYSFVELLLSRLGDKLFVPSFVLMTNITEQAVISDFLLLQLGSSPMFLSVVDVCHLVADHTFENLHHILIICFFPE